MNDTKKPGSLVALVLGGVAVLAAVGLAVYFWPPGEQPSPIEPEKKPPFVDNANKKEKDSSNAGNGANPLTVQPVAYEPGPTSLAAATEFLYSGPKPVQVGMDKKALDAKRAAALRGLVFKQKDEPFPGVNVAIQNQPRYGVGTSRPDGTYDMVVNGGGLMTVGFTREGYLPVWRQTAVPWLDYTWLPPVVMTTVDSEVTPVKSHNKSLQVARGNVVSDKHGKRQTTLIFPGGTTATMELPDGSEKKLATLNVRATEYTVGDKGPERMPAPLPANSGYTYCVDLSVDEAVKAGAKKVRFVKPVYHYVENFLDFPVGIPVPIGYFDPDKGAWIPSESGRIIKILAIKAGLAILDVAGKGKAANDKELLALNVSEDERKELAKLYQVGTSVWRAPIPHFSVWDCNWGFSPPKDAVSPGQPPPRPDEPNKADKPVRETVRIPGIDWKLHYHSDRTPSATPPRTIDIPVAGTTIPASLKRIDLEIFVAGRRFEFKLSAKPEQKQRFTWDGIDAFGRRLHGAQNVRVRIGYVYDGVYEVTPVFGANGNGEVITGSRTRQEVVFWQEHLIVMGGFDARFLGMGGWSFGVQHAYDPVSRTLYLGNGERHTAETDGAQISNQIISTVAGGGVKKDLGDGGPALLARLDDPTAQPGAGFARHRGPHSPRGLAIAPDGTLFIADANDRIRRVDPDGKISTIAGAGKSNADRGKAIDLRLQQPGAIALGPDGSLFIAEGDYAHRITRLDANGTLTKIAGGNGQGFAGDGAAALKAQFKFPTGLAVTPDGTLYVADQGNHRIRRITPDGVITTIAGDGKQGFSGDGGPAIKAQLYWPTSLALGPDGSLYFSDQGNYVIRRVSTSGIITTVAGMFRKEWSPQFGGDDGPALQAKFDDPTGLAVAADGSLYIADTENHRIRRVGPDGIVSTFAGADKPKDHGDFGGDNGPARLAKLSYPTALAFGPDGSLCFYDASYQRGAGNADSRHIKQRIRRITPALPGFSNTEIAVASPNLEAKELYKFNAVGQHLETLDAVSKALRIRLEYDETGRLTKIADASGHAAKIERDGKRQPESILTHDGQKTAIELDAYGYLERLTYPDGTQVRMIYAADGLLKQITTPPVAKAAAKPPAAPEKKKQVAKPVVDSGVADGLSDFDVSRAEPGAWQMQDSGVKDDLHSVAFINDQIGVAVGANYTILRTTDGGKSWGRVMGPKEQSGVFASVIFANDKVGYVRNQGTSDVYRTADAGATWQNIKTPYEADFAPPGGFSNHAVAGDLYFWQNSFIGGRLIYVTKAGAAWTKLWESDDLLGAFGVSLAFPTPQEGWMASTCGSATFFVGRSTDGGKTWKKQEIKHNDKLRDTYMHLQAVDKDHGWCTAGIATHVYASTDGGATWTPHELGNADGGSQIAGLQFVDVKTGYALCGANLWNVRKTSDGGKSWRSLGALKAPDTVNGMFFTPSGLGFVVGAKGYIARFQAK